MKNLDAVLGGGYDLLAGNPAASLQDPGYKIGGRIIRMEYSGDTIPAGNTGHDWAVPDCCHISYMPACSYYATSKDSHSISEYQDTLRVNADVSIGASGPFWSAAFSMSADYQKAESDFSEHDMHIELTQAFCQAYVAAVKGTVTSKQLDLDPSFRESVRNLPAQFSLEEYQAFVVTYGSHVVTEAAMGGKWTRYTSFTSDKYQHLEDESIDVAVEAKADMFWVSGSVSTETDEQKHKREEFEQSSFECFNMGQGGKGMPPGVPFDCSQPSSATGDWEKWEDEVNGFDGNYAGPYPIKDVKLVPISRILNIQNFSPSGEDPSILQKADALEQALKCYLAGWDENHEDCQSARLGLVHLGDPEQCVVTGNACNAIGATCCDSAATCFSDADGDKCHNTVGESCHCLLEPACDPPCGEHGKCAPDNKCVCDADYSGSRCNTHIDTECRDACHSCVDDPPHGEGGEYCIYESHAECVRFQPVGGGCASEVVTDVWVDDEGQCDAACVIRK